MKQEFKKKPILDPRIELIILMIINISIFTMKSSRVTDIWCIFISVLLVYSGHWKSALNNIVVYFLAVFIQTSVLSVLPEIFIMIFSVSLNYLRKIFPCIMMGNLIIKTTTMKRVILALRKMHISEKFIIPVSVTIRYFPTIIQEMGNIKDAMKLRKIPIQEKAEAMVIPLMISATNVAEELAAAAVTRGIENPCKKTSIEELHFKVFDFICLFISIVILFTENIF